MTAEGFPQPSFERDESTIDIIAISRKSDKPKPENEDAEFVDAEHNVYVVADGVSRYQYDQDRSPAARASREAATALGRALAELPEDAEDISREDFRAAFMRANEAVRHVNETETLQIDTGETTTLWDSADFMNRDLAGTVAAAAVKRGNRVYFGFIGDCRMARLTEAGDFTWQALTAETDRVAQAQASFGALRSTLPPKEDPQYAEARYRYIRAIHTEYRNNPSASSSDAPHPTYGVLTGQPEAVDELYLQTGDIEMEPGERLVLYSDGVEPYMAQPEFRALLLTASPEEVNDYIDANKAIDTANDDKTLLVVPS